MPIISTDRALPDWRLKTALAAHVNVGFSEVQVLHDDSSGKYTACACGVNNCKNLIAAAILYEYDGNTFGTIAVRENPGNNLQRADLDHELSCSVVRIKKY